MIKQLAINNRPIHYNLEFIKHLIFLGIIIATLPFWLPTSLGGDTSYHFVLTDSMEGSLDPGSFVVLRRSDAYEVGDAVGYRLDLGDGAGATILHRIVGRLPNGNYVLKGDAVESTEEVEREAINGRMVFAVPRLGFLPGAFRQAPLLLGGMLVALFFLSGGLMKKVDRRTKGGGTAQAQAKDWAKQENLFIPAALVVLVSLPFATATVANLLPPFANLGPAEVLLGKVPLFAMLLAILTVTRVGEVIWVKGSQGSSLGSLSGINYTAVMILAASVIPFMELVNSARAVLTL